MSKLVWIHQFNESELGLDERGGFCLVPVRARSLLEPLSESNGYRTQVDVYFNGNFVGKQRYAKQLSKNKYKLSLAGKGFKKLIGDGGEGSPIQPGFFGCFYKIPEGINLDILDDNSVYVSLFKQITKSNNYKNLVTEAIFDAELEESSEHESKEMQVTKARS